jgi:hypothetical protein
MSSRSVNEPEPETIRGEVMNCSLKNKGMDACESYQIF